MLTIYRRHLKTCIGAYGFKLHYSGLLPLTLRSLCAFAAWSAVHYSDPVLWSGGTRYVKMVHLNQRRSMKNDRSSSSSPQT